MRFKELAEGNARLFSLILYLGFEDIKKLDNLVDYIIMIKGNRRISFLSKF